MKNAFPRFYFEGALQNSWQPEHRSILAEYQDRTFISCSIPALKNTRHTERRKRHAALDKVTVRRIIPTPILGIYVPHLSAPVCEEMGHLSTVT